MANPAVTNVDGSNPGPNVVTVPDTVQSPIGNLWKVGTFALTLSPSAVASVTAPEQTFAATGIGLLVGDRVYVECSAPLAGVGVINARVSAADTLALQFINPTAGSLTPTASTVYYVTVFRQQPNWTAPASGNQFDWQRALSNNPSTIPRGNTAVLWTSALTLSPASVAANTTAEQTFTFTGTKLGDCLTINKPSAQAGLGIVGARVTAANTIGITFINATGSPITPTASETYIIQTSRADNVVSPGVPLRQEAQCRVETRAFAPLYAPTGLGGTPAGALLSSVTVAASTTAAASAQLPGGSPAGGGPQLQISNTTSAWAYVTFGVYGNVVASTVATGYPVAPGTVVVVSVHAEVTGASVILASGSGNVVFTRGEGV